MIIIETYPDSKVEIRGADNHHVSVILLVTTGGATTTIIGEVIVIMYQHACNGKNTTINSSPQIENYRSIVDDHSIQVGGVQHITTLNIHRIHMSIRGALT